MRILRLSLAGLALLGAGAVIGWSAKPSRLNARLYAHDRLVAVQFHLDDAPDDYILLAGDSQAEFQSPAQRICGIELVNGGIGGTTAAIYADLASTLSIKTRPRAVALFIGTNDLKMKKTPRSYAAMTRFDEATERIVRRFQAVSDRVVVTAIPPIGRSLGDRLDAAAVRALSNRIQALCTRIGCVYADPFADLRDGDSGYALPGTLRDELHIAAYRRVMTALEPALCPNGPP